MRERFKSLPGQTVGLMIAQHFRQKGLPQAIEALAKIDKRISLLIVGRDNPARKEKFSPSVSGVSDRVIFAGTTDSPADFYAAADFFILPTSYDSCSLVVLEALAMGLPIISTIFNGACEIMTGGAEGFVLQDPKNVPAQAEAMAKMLDPTRRAAMKAAALALRPPLLRNPSRSSRSHLRPQPPRPLIRRKFNRKFLPPASSPPTPSSF